MKIFQIYRLAVYIIFLLLPAVSHAESNILILGDSLSAGYGIPRESSWPSLLQRELDRTHPQYRVINASISGETSSGGLRRLPAALKEHNPRIVILELGANDGLRGTKLDLTRKSLAGLIRLVKNSGARVLLVGMQIPPNYGPDYTRRFKQVFPELSKQYQVPLVPFLLTGLTLEDFQADNLHPIAEAQGKILKTVMLYLGPML